MPEVNQIFCHETIWIRFCRNDAMESERKNPVTRKKVTTSVRPYQPSLFDPVTLAPGICTIFSAISLYCLSRATSRGVFPSLSSLVTSKPLARRRSMASSFSMRAAA